MVFWAMARGLGAGGYYWLIKCLFESLGNKKTAKQASRSNYFGEDDGA
jgi:hypothetical protein